MQVCPGRWTQVLPDANSVSIGSETPDQWHDSAKLALPHHLGPGFTFLAFYIFFFQNLLFSDILPVGLRWADCLSVSSCVWSVWCFRRSSCPWSKWCLLSLLQWTWTGPQWWCLTKSIVSNIARSMKLTIGPEDKVLFCGTIQLFLLVRPASNSPHANLKWR